MGPEVAALSDAPVTIVLGRDADVVRARQAAQHLGRALGLTTSARARLDLVVAEIATNAVRHAGRGVIVLEPDAMASRRLMVRCLDRGPGIAATSEAQRSAPRGLGLGLAVVREMANHLTISSSAEGGTVVEARVWD